MRLSLNYADSPDAPPEEHLTIGLTLPDEITQLIGVEERIDLIGKRISELTLATFSLSCNSLNLNDVQFSSKTIDKWTRGVTFNQFVLVLVFQRRKSRSYYRRELKILAPSQDTFPDYLYRRNQQRKKRKSLTYNLHQPEHIRPQNNTHQQSIDAINDIAQQMLMLLNAEPHPLGNNYFWEFKGFHPWWSDGQIHKQQKKLRKRLEKAKNKAKKSTKPKSKKHGKGRRYGAIPGKFMGVQFRSQLEIRFVTAAEQRGFEWIYEEERLGDGNYLVDFHLPECQAWVEVKGRFEARDHYLLKDVAETLKERNEQLFVFTSGKPMRVTLDSFEKISSKEFWQILTQAHDSTKPSSDT